MGLILKPAHHPFGGNPIINRGSQQAKGLDLWLPCGMGRSTLEKDYSINNAVGTLGSGTTRIVTSEGRAFNNGSAATTVSPALVMHSMSATVCGWIYATALPVGDHMCYFSRYVAFSSNSNFAISVQPNGSVLFFFYGDDLASSASVIAAGKWYHLACRYNADTKDQRIFLNGVSIASRTATAGFTASGGTLNLGAWSTANNVWNGRYRDVRIYRRVLTNSEIAALYDPRTRFDLYSPQSQRTYFAGSGSAPIFPSTGLTGHWKCDEAAGANDLIDTLGAHNFVQTSSPGSAAGVISTARDFDGTADYASIAPHADFNSVNKMTWNQWVYRDGSSGGALSSKLDFVHGWELREDYIYFESAQRSFTPPGTGAWKMYTFVFDGSLTGEDRLKVYINGQRKTLSVDSGTIPATIGDHSAYTLRISRNSTSSAQFFDGRFDEIAHWKEVALTQDQILDLYNNGAGLTYTAATTAGIPPYKRYPKRSSIIRR